MRMAFSSSTKRILLTACRASRRTLCNWAPPWPSDKVNETRGFAVGKRCGHGLREEPDQQAGPRSKQARSARVHSLPNRAGQRSLRAPHAVRNTPIGADQIRWPALRRSRRRDSRPAAGSEVVRACQLHCVQSWPVTSRTGCGSVGRPISPLQPATCHLGSTWAARAAGNQMTSL